MSLVAAKTLLATDEHRSTQMGNQTFVLCVVRLRDEPILDSDLHCDEVQILTEYKMALQQHSAGSNGKASVKWIFRHDKIRDYFLMHTFWATPDEIIPKHISPRKFESEQSSCESALQRFGLVLRPVS